MYKKKSVRKIGLPSDHRKLLVKSLVKDLISRSIIKTTIAKSFLIAKQVDILADYILKGNMKKAYDYVRDDVLLEKFSKIVLDSGRFSGFVKKVKIGNRKGDNSQLVLLELLNSSKKNTRDLVNE